MSSKTIKGGIGAGLLLSLMLLLSGCGPAEAPLQDGTITIDSTPEQGAQVFINGELFGVTPLTLDEMPVAKLDILLKHDRYLRAFDHIEVKPGQAITYVIDMEPRVGMLSLSSTPPGATIYLGENDEVFGKTPIEKKPVPIGECKYRLELEHYYSVSDSFTVEEDFQYEFNHQLKPLEGEIVVSSRPAGANIWINNQLQPQKAPARFKLLPGPYLISVHSKGYIQKDARLELAPAASEEVMLVMERGHVPAGMVLVPSGEFIRGSKISPDESPEVKLSLKAFYIDKYEVTNAEFKEVFPSHTFQKGWENYPVAGVSWEQAMAYAHAVHKRLPTEAEWEKAARGVDGREYPWGKEFDATLCNTKEHGARAPLKVGELFIASSPYGCIGMAGNVYEWTHNWYEAYEGNTVVTKDYGQVYRVLRGGSYMTDRFTARCARRHFDRMDASRADYGFRCAMDAVD